MSTLTNYSKKVEKLVEDHRQANLTYSSEFQARKKARQEVKDGVEAQQILQTIAKGIQESAHKKITTIVNRCLRAIFYDDAYEFAIVFEEKRGRTEAKPTFVRRGHHLDPTTESGIGTVEVAAFALRLARLLLSRTQPRRLLVLDEPFKSVSAWYRERVRSLLDALASELDFQFVMVTHIEELKTGKVIQL